MWPSCETSVGIASDWGRCLLTSQSLISPFVQSQSIEPSWLPIGKKLWYKHVTTYYVSVHDNTLSSNPIIREDPDQFNPEDHLVPDRQQWQFCNPKRTGHYLQCTANGRTIHLLRNSQTQNQKNVLKSLIWEKKNITVHILQWIMAPSLYVTSWTVPGFLVLIKVKKSQSMEDVCSRISRSSLDHRSLV